jgi:UDP-perosamine 4-acetyltransferase
MISRLAVTPDTEMPVIVIGGGGHGRVVLQVLLSMERIVAGVIDPDPAVMPLLPAGVPLLGGDEVLGRWNPSQFELANGIGSVGRVDRRRANFERCKSAGFRFARVIHPSAILAPDVLLGEGCQVMAGAVIQTGSRIGLNAIVNTAAIIDHDCVVGDHAHVAPGVVLSGGVVVGPACHLGTGSIVIQNIMIGAGALVGAGTTVVSNVPEGTRVVGPRGTQEAS